jgi:hypothetical protein|tara:strand:- start:10130 stop:10303 length:174 start_codon:yes stop_codon:yes gene_type:complete
MGQNKKLFNNIREYELRQDSLEKQNERLVLELTPVRQRETVKTIINTLKPKQNGKRN